MCELIPTTDLHMWELLSTFSTPTLALHVKKIEGPLSAICVQNHLTFYLRGSMGTIYLELKNGARDWRSLVM